MDFINKEIDADITFDKVAIILPRDGLEPNTLHDIIIHLCINRLLERIHEAHFA